MEIYEVCLRWTNPTPGSSTQAYFEDQEDAKHFVQRIFEKPDIQLRWGVAPIGLIGTTTSNGSLVEIRRVYVNLRGY